MRQRGFQPGSWVAVFALLSFSLFACSREGGSEQFERIGANWEVATKSRTIFPHSVEERRLLWRNGPEDVRLVSERVGGVYFLGGDCVLYLDIVPSPWYFMAACGEKNPIEVVPYNPGRWVVEKGSLKRLEFTGEAYEESKVIPFEEIRIQAE